MIVTLDGPAGAGKSSAAKALAKTLSYAPRERALLEKALGQELPLGKEDG